MKFPVPVFLTACIPTTFVVYVVLSVTSAGQGPNTTPESSLRHVRELLLEHIEHVSIAPIGQSYESVVPDTLDLAERAQLAINVLLGNLEPNKSCGVYQAFKFSSPPEMGGLTWNLPAKNARALPWMRCMCGSEQGLELERNLMQSLVLAVDSDGLAYVPIENDGAPAGTAYPFANALLALAADNWYQRDRQSAWLELAGQITKALDRSAIRQENRAYFPPECSLRPDGSWAWTMRGQAKIPYKPPEEPYLEQQGLEGCVKYEQAAPLRALVVQYRRDPSISNGEILQQLKNFMLKPGMWENTSSEGFPGNEHGVFAGHFHGNMVAIHALMELAVATEDSRLKQLVRESYDHARRTGVIRLGWFPGWLKPESHHRDPNLFLASETCGVSDMLLLAVKLSDAGLGDYWDDVDTIVRNHLVAQQIIDFSEMRRLAGGDERHDLLLKRFLGGFNQSMEGWINSTGPHCWGCCTANGSIGLYYAWHGITRFDADVATVNLWLNRASPWMDIDSYLPYEGKLVLHNKQAKTALVRLPYWINREKLVVRIDDVVQPHVICGNQVIIRELKPQSTVSLEVPVPSAKEQYTVGDRQYTLELRGSTVINLTPRSNDPNFYQYYEREKMRATTAPLSKVTRFVADQILPLQ